MTAGGKEGGSRRKRHGPGSGPDRQGHGNKEQDREGGPRSRPTPVRDVMEAGRERTPAGEVPSRHFEREGEEWVVRVEGRTRSGRAADAGAPLLHLRFYRGEEAREPERHMVVAGESLDGFHEEELGRLLERARPWGAPRPFYEDSSDDPRRSRGR